MSEIKDGGPAFPLFFPESKARDGRTTRPRDEHVGMTLRDYFAAAALTGFCGTLGHDSENGPIWNPRGVSHRAYSIADAMLKAREAK